MNDLRFALRQFAKSPGFTAVAVISLALAIGANSAVFALVDALFLRPAISLRPDELVNVYTARTGADRAYRAFSFAEYSLLRESKEVFADAAAFRTALVGVGPTGSAEMRRKFGMVVSENYFSMLGATPVAGRFFLPEEARPGAGIPVVVVSHAMWESLGGDAGFADTSISINGEPWSIVGVVPKGFSGGNSVLAPDIWLPTGMAARVSEGFGKARANRDLTDPAYFALFVIARVQQGLTPEAAESRLPALAARLTTIAADAAQGSRTLEVQRPSRFGFSTEPSSDGPLALFGALLLGMSGVVLLVACLNVANMFLARGTARAQELAVRSSLGASRSRLVRLLAMEGFVFSLAGGAAGLLLSSWASQLLTHSLMGNTFISSFGFALAIDASPDLRVLLATLGFCTLATVIFSIGPALRVTRGNKGGHLAMHGSDYTMTDRGGRLFSGRHCLLMAQLAFSLALLFAAGLFLRAAHAAANLDPGFQPEGDLVAELDYALVDCDDAEARGRMIAAVDALRAHPEVHHAALGSLLPFGGVGNSLDLTAVDAASEGEPRRSSGRITAVSAGYFDALGVGMLRGRDFTESEWRDPDGPRVVVIDELMAALLFPNEDPMGKMVERTRRPHEATSERMEVIGVVSTHRDKVFSSGPPPRIFLPLAKRYTPHVFVHLRGKTGNAVLAGALPDAVRTELKTLDAAVPLVQLAPFSAIIDGNLELWSVRFVAVLFAAFGGIALLLSVAGVYGVKAFIVARRTREFGIRVALGARPGQVCGLVVKQGAAQIAIGLFAGLLLALATGQVLSSMLLRVSPHDPLVLVVAVVPLAAAALLATWWPARRATRVNPIEALRAE